MAPKRIVLLLPDLIAGGAQIVFLQLAEEFQRAGHDVDVVVGDMTGQLVAKVPRTINVVDLSKGACPRSRFMFACKFGISLRRYVRDSQPDVLLSSLTGTNLLVSIVRLTCRQSFSLVLREANTRHNQNSRVIVKLTSLFYRYANAIVAVSQGVKQDLLTRISLHPQLVHVIANPHDINDIRARMGTVPTHPWLRNQSIPVIVAVGRLTYQKGFDVLLRAFALSLQSTPMRLLILGEGEQRNTLERLAADLRIADHVDMPGYIENPVSYINKASLYAMSSRWEGLPNSLIEALLTGIRIVATNCHSGPSEILENGRLGHLVPVDDPEALSCAMLDQLEASSDEASLQDVAKRYSPETIAAQYLTLFSRLG